MDRWEKLKSVFDRRVSFKFLVTVAAAIIMVFIIMFIWISGELERHIMDQVRKQAIILHRQIVLTRQWVAEHGTILAPKGPNLKPSSYISDSVVNVDQNTEHVRISPSMLTSILSDMALEEGLYTFRLRGPAPLNPGNKPDEIEMLALKKIREGDHKGIFHRERTGDGEALRYIAPVVMSKNCMECHGSKGFKVGDIGGVLSVIIPMDNAAKAIKQSSNILLAGGVALAGALITLVFLSARFIVFQRLSDVKRIMTRIAKEPLPTTNDIVGDEIAEIVNLCGKLDEQMRNRRDELERSIIEATRDLYNANQELARVNQELKRLDSAKKEFFTDISHELKGPLTNIKGATSLLKRKLGDRETNYLDIIENNSDHLSKVIMDFLEYSKIEAGHLELDIVLQPLSKVLNESVQALLADSQRNLVLIVKKGVPETEAYYDFRRIYQVLTNLLSNALRYAPTNSQIELTVLRTNGEALVSVADMGPGIDPVYHDSIFKKFYQTPNEKTGQVNKGSSGIGLAICKGIIEAHDGRIWVESSPGNGSTFKFTLPARKDGHDR